MTRYWQTFTKRALLVTFHTCTPTQGDCIVGWRGVYGVTITVFGYQWFLGAIKSADWLPSQMEEIAPENGTSPRAGDTQEPV